jgi:hypothetical protein
MWVWYTLWIALLMMSKLSLGVQESSEKVERQEKKKSQEKKPRLMNENMPPPEVV